MTKFRDLRIGDRFVFKKLGKPTGRYVKTSEYQYGTIVPGGLGRARGGEAVERLPPEPTAEDVAELTGHIVKRDAGPTED